MYSSEDGERAVQEEPASVWGRAGGVTVYEPQTSINLAHKHVEFKPLCKEKRKLDQGR